MKAGHVIAAVIAVVIVVVMILVVVAVSTTPQAFTISQTGNNGVGVSYVTIDSSGAATLTTDPTKAAVVKQSKTGALMFGDSVNLYDTASKLWLGAAEKVGAGVWVHGVNKSPGITWGFAPTSAKAVTDGSGPAKMGTPVYWFAVGGAGDTSAKSVVNSKGTGAGSLLFSGIPSTGAADAWKSVWTLTAKRPQIGSN